MAHILFKTLLKEQIHKIQEWDPISRLGLSLRNENENHTLESHDHAHVFEIQCLLTNLLQLVKIIKFATTSPASGTSSMGKMELDAENVLMGVMQKVQQMKERLSKYQGQVCIPLLHAKESLLQKQEQEMKYILDCVHKGDTESLARFAVHSAEVIQTRLDVISSTDKNVNICQREVTHLTTDVNAMMDIITDLTASEDPQDSYSEASDNSCGFSMRRMAAPFSPVICFEDDTESRLPRPSPCHFRLAEDIPLATQTCRMRTKHDTGNVNYISQIASDIRMGLLGNDVTNPHSSIDTEKNVDIANGAILQSSWVPLTTNECNFSLNGHVNPGYSECSFHSVSSQWKTSVTSLTSTADEQEFTDQFVSAAGLEEFLEQEVQKSIASCGQDAPDELDTSGSRHPPSIRCHSSEKSETTRVVTSSMSSVDTVFSSVTKISVKENEESVNGSCGMGDTHNCEIKHVFNIVKTCLQSVKGIHISTEFITCVVVVVFLLCLQLFPQSDLFLNFPGLERMLSRIIEVRSYGEAAY